MKSQRHILHKMMQLGSNEADKYLSDFAVKLKNEIFSTKDNDKIYDILDMLDEFVYKDLKENPWHKEGHNNKEWVLLDYISVVVHIFKNDRREFFGLEKLWGDAKTTLIED